MMTERVRPPAKFDGAGRLIDQLQQHGPFATKQAVMMFAAALGRMRGELHPIEGFGEGIRWQIFERNADDAYINALAVAHTDSISVLNDDVDDGGHEIDGRMSKTTIFEQYAAAGLQYLADRVVSKPEDILDQLLVLIRTAEHDAARSSTQLLELSADDLEFLGGV